MESSEYISREAAIDVMCEILCDGRENCDENTCCCSANLMKSIPAADVRPVVRCADCKWFQNNMRQDGYLPKGVPEWECRHWCGPCDPTDFCSYGAKMEG